MKLITYRGQSGTRAGRLEGDSIVTLPFSDVGALLSSGHNWLATAAGDGEKVALSEVSLAPTVTNPTKIFCLGQNYTEHFEEQKIDRPPAPYPTLFAKFTDSLTGPNNAITLPKASDRVDWEAEMVVVIGKTVRHASDTEAVEAIAGYAVGNDVTIRDWQRRTTEWLQGKVWQSATPLGVMVTRDELGTDGRPDLAITCEVDGEMMQNSRTSKLIFDCVASVRYISTIITLRPGDLIFTGTCSGVGFVRKPPIFLKPGQTVTTTIENIGSCINQFVAED